MEFADSKSRGLRVRLTAASGETPLKRLNRI